MCPNVRAAVVLNEVKDPLFEKQVLRFAQDDSG
jgi:hypothetical protein